MTTRDRIAKRLREIVVPPIGFEDANWLADAVLDELNPELEELAALRRLAVEAALFIKEGVQE